MSHRDAAIVVTCKTCGYEATVYSWGKTADPLEHPLGGYLCLCHYTTNKHEVERKMGSRILSRRMGTT